MIPDYEPTIPEWFHQQFELDRFLAEQRDRVDAEEKEIDRRRRRYFAATAICWLVASFVILISTERTSLRHKGSAEPIKASQPYMPAASEIPAPLNIVYVPAQSSMSPLLSESDELKQVIDQLGAIEVQASLYKHTGESYSGPLWVRKVKRGDAVYLEDAALFVIDGPFRLRLPSNSTVYIYAPADGLDWNGGWGVQIRTPSCSQTGMCAVRLEDLMIASMGK